MKKFADIFILIAGISWGVIGVFVTQLNSLGFTSVQASALRLFFTALIMPVIVFFYDKSKFKIKLRDMWYFVCTGILCILMCSTLYFITIPFSNIAIANILMYTSPIWIILLSVPIFRERITSVKILSLVLAFSGCVFVTGALSSTSAITPLGIVTGLGSGLCYGLYSIFGKAALKKYDSITVTLYTLIFAGIGSLFICSLPETIGIMRAQPGFIAPLLFIVLLCTVLPYTVYTVGLKHTTASRASIISCSEPLTASVISIFAMHDSFTYSQLIGIFLIIASIILLQIPNQKK